MNKMTFNEWLKYHGISKNKFCERFGVERRLVNKWFNGESSPTVSSFRVLADGVFTVEKELKSNLGTNPYDMLP